MASCDIERYREILRKLQNEGERTTALNDLKHFIDEKSGPEIVPVIRNVGITQIVRCIDQEKSLQGLACDALKMIFLKLDIGDVIKVFTSHIMYLLRHDKVSARLIAVEEVSRAVTSDINILSFPEYVDVFIAVIQLLLDNDERIANRAVEITSRLPNEAYPRVLEEMKITLDHTASSKCYAFDVVTNISERSQDLFNLSVDTGYIDIMLSELETKDFLYHLNVLTFLTKLSTNIHAMNLLVKKGVLEMITVMIQDLHQNSLEHLLTPGYLKFIGTIAHHYPREIFNKYSTLIEYVIEKIDSADTSNIVALDTLGFIGATVEGKLSLIAIGKKYLEAVEKVCLIIKDHTTVLRLAAINCLASLVGIHKYPNEPDTEPIDKRVTLMTREWFRSLSTHPSSIQFLFQMCKYPFADIKMAALNLLDAVCQHQWGQELVATTEGFVTYLLDRSKDISKETSELKYDIIKRLSTSMSFEPNVLELLETYVTQGPFYPAREGFEISMEQGN